MSGIEVSLADSNITINGLRPHSQSEWKRSLNVAAKERCLPKHCRRNSRLYSLPPVNCRWCGFPFASVSTAVSTVWHVQPTQIPPGEATRDLGPRSSLQDVVLNSETSRLGSYVRYLSWIDRHPCHMDMCSLWTKTTQNARTVARSEQYEDDLWQRDMDDKWTDHWVSIGLGGSRGPIYYPSVLCLIVTAVTRTAASRVQRLL
jgi:hypothetical protein